MALLAPTPAVGGMHVDRDLLRKYDVPGPRYTSYPTALQFTEAVDDAAVSRRLDALGKSERPLSLYFHLPFCERMCWYCACTKVITRKNGLADVYLDHLFDELDRRRRFTDGRPVVQMHFGGGTPTFLSADQLARLGRKLRDTFDFADDAEISVEIDPRHFDADQAAVLREVGFNRASIGFQDSTDEVQQAINRIQPMAMNRACIALLREHGFGSINADVIYGLPHQTPETFAQTLDDVIGLGVDRLAVYSYAHVPWAHPSQKLLEREALPDAEAKLGLLAQAIETLTERGYDYIGMDHFALPDDELAVARRNGTLRRNFQGYSTWSGVEIFAYGMSAISQTDDMYFQNEKDLGDYQSALDGGRLPVVRGVVLTADDQIRRSLIMAVMCQTEVDYAQMSAELGVDVATAFADAIADLAPMEADGLVVRHDDRLEITETGRLFIRNIAMVFDAYLRAKAGDEAPRYSRTV